MRACFYCGVNHDGLRPYGPEGAPVCLPCLKTDKARNDAAVAVFRALLEAAEAASPYGTALIDGDGYGPVPLTNIDRWTDAGPA